jgi:ribosome-binding protein aMBF1 (putative translation factor)
MIANERQYRITKSEAQKFAASVAKFEAQPPTELHPLLVKAQRDALMSQLEELQEDILEYETLRNSGQIGLDLENILELPKALIKARVAVGLTQKQLAERLGLKEQQVQQYESTFYKSANLERVMQVAKVLSQAREADF